MLCSTSPEAEPKQRQSLLGRALRAKAGRYQARNAEFGEGYYSLVALRAREYSANDVRSGQPEQPASTSGHYGWYGRARQPVPQFSAALEWRAEPGATRTSLKILG